jgi:mannosidase alpha-like ER degradation enhancer 2
MPDRIAVPAFLLAAFAALAAYGCDRARHEDHAQQLASRVRSEFLHAWNNYERYAWSHDALWPLSKTAHDWYGHSLLMTPVDALDTLILMHLDTEAARARSVIVRDLLFDLDIYVKNFEITIRLLGGLLSSYQLTGDKRLLSLAEDLGNRLLPTFTNRPALCLCQSPHRADTECRNESGRNRNLCYSNLGL